MFRAFGTIVVALILFPSAAPAQNGVHVDPESPAGKEYAIPLVQARSEAGGGDTRAGGQAGPLFGAGIGEASGAGRQSSGGDEGGDAGGTGSGGGSGGSAERTESGGADTQHSAAVEAAVGGGSDAALTGIIVAAVLAGALLAGFALRRGLRTS